MRVEDLLGICGIVGGYHYAVLGRIIIVSGTLSSMLL